MSLEILVKILNERKKVNAYAFMQIYDFSSFLAYFN